MPTKVIQINGMRFAYQYQTSRTTGVRTYPKTLLESGVTGCVSGWHT
jgi:hypothetical protein